jgi:hypothetical protein
MGNASMRKFGTRTIVRGACLVAVLAILAIPLANLMVAQTAVSESVTGQVDNDFATAANELSASATPMSEGDGGSAVSALMAGNAVGLPISSVIDLRHPASAFVP